MSHEPIDLMHVVNCLEQTARRIQGLLIVGNGSLARLAGTSESDGHKIVFQGAMGMAGAAAFGFSQASGRPSIVLEGDGNFLMGSPSSDWLAARRSPTLHVVVSNGEYLTSGGQLLPFPVESTTQGDRIDTERGFIDALRSWAPDNGYKLIILIDASVRLGDLRRPQQTLSRQRAAVQKLF